MLRTGKLTVKLSPEDAQEIRDVATADIETIVAKFEEYRERVDNIDTILPAEPDWGAIDELVYEAYVPNLGSKK